MSSDARQRVHAYLRRLDEQRRTLADEVEPDVAPFRGMSMAQRARAVESVCRSAWAVLRSRPDFHSAARWRDPLSPEAEATWLRLVAEERARRGRR